MSKITQKTFPYKQIKQIGDYGVEGNIIYKKKINIAYAQLLRRVVFFLCCITLGRRRSDSDVDTSKHDISDTVGEDLTGMHLI